MGTVTPGYTLKLHSFAGHTFVARQNSVEVARFVVGTELPQVWAVP
jgi:hypothetical protein